MSCSGWVARGGTGFGLLLVAFALLLGPAPAASAHAVLASSSPANGVVLPEAPSEVVLTFSEPVRRVADRIRVLAPDGSRVDRGEPSVRGGSLTVRIDPAGQGTYLVTYRVISADSHPVSGAFTYSVGAPSTPPADDGQTERTDPVVGIALPIAKYLGYLGLILLMGTVLMLSRLWPRRLPRRQPGRLALTGLALVGVATLGTLWLQVPYTTGGGLLGVDGAALAETLGSTFGVALLVRLGLLIAMVLPLRALATPDVGRSDQIILAVLAVTALLTWPLSGHPAASPLPPVSVVVDAAHLGAMALWLGGLVVLVGFLLRQADERETAAILPVWSRWAALAVVVLLLAGTVQALIEVGTLGALLNTTYGRLLLAKIGLFGSVLLVASYVRRLARGRSDQPHAIRRAVLAELAITAVVLALSAALVQTTPARTAVAQARQGALDFYATTLTSPIYSLRVEVDPSRRGRNTVHMYAYTPDNKPLPVVEWRATAAQPASGIEPIEIPLTTLTDNHAEGEIKVPTAGDWRFRFTLRISDIDQATVTATVPVK